MRSPSLAFTTRALASLAAALLASRCTGATAPTVTDDVPDVPAADAAPTDAAAMDAPPPDAPRPDVSDASDDSSDVAFDAPPPDAPPPPDASPGDAPTDVPPRDAPAPDVAGDAPDVPVGDPQTWVYAITALTIDSALGGAAPNPMTHAQGVAGFNLDGRTTGPASGAPADCAHGDFFSALDPDQDLGSCVPGQPRGGSTCVGGVDNQLPELASIFSGFGTDLRASMLDDVAQGRTAIVLRVTDVNGVPGPALDDPAVGVQVYPVARPLFASCASIGAPGLPYAVDDASLTTPGDLSSARLSYTGRIVRGRLLVDPPSDPTRAVFPFTMTVMASPLTFSLQAAQVRLSMTPDRATGGNLGGYTPLAAIVAQLRPLLPAGIPEATVTTVLQSLVDVQLPAGDSMGCVAPNGGVSMGLGFTASRAALSATTVRGPMTGACGGPAVPVGGCYTEPAAASVCPSAAVAQADPTRPTYRVTHLQVTAPAALVSPILVNVINDAIHRGNLLWGLSLDVPGRTIRSGALNPARFTRGVTGQGLFDGTFRYFSGDAPTPGAAARWDASSTTLTGTTASAASGTFPATLRLPILDTAGALLVELPLDAVRFTVIRPADGTRCVGLGAPSGGSFNECTSAWQTADAAMAPYGQVEAVITVPAARDVRVSALGTTLCNLLSGNDCDTVPQAMWTRQPDAMVGATPGYRFSASFAAVSARIP